jgi:predicted transposase YbfD/YdcC
MVETLIGLFKEVPDPRRGNAIAHRLDEVLAIAVLAMLCECGRYTEMEMFASANEEWLKTFMELPGGVPSHDTFGDIMAAVDPDAVERAFVEWAESLREGSASEVVAIDGKVARRSKGGDGKGRGTNVVSAWACGSRVVLGQLACEEKSNEITAIPKLLEMLALDGCIVTIDAMGTQKEIAEKIVNRGADYVLSLKENQPGLLEDVELFFKDPPAGVEFDYAKTEEKSHGRMERRECTSCNDAAWLSGAHPGWAGLSGIGMVVSERTPVKGGATPENFVHYLIFSKGDMTASELLEAKRAHWGVENSLHWVLDMDFREDEARMRMKNAAENMATIRRVCINLLKADGSNPKLSVNLKRKKCMFSKEYLLKVAGIT